MNIDVVLIPDNIEKISLYDKCIVVIDVLRASTTIITALAHGAKEILPFSTVDEARKEMKRYSEENVLLCGERGGEKILGFDLGNSPREYRMELIENKIIFFTSTNGTNLLVKTQLAKRVFIGGFINAHGIVGQIEQLSMDCIFACSGREGEFSLEDAVCAGFYIHCLKNQKGFTSRFSDGALACGILYDHFADDLEGMIQLSHHGQYLKQLGFEADLSYCIDVNAFNTVPCYQNGSVKRLDDCL